MIKRKLNSRLLDDTQKKEKKYKIEINNKESKRFYTLEQVQKKIKKNKDANIVITIYEYPYLPKDERQPFLFNF